MSEEINITNQNADSIVKLPKIKINLPWQICLVLICAVGTLALTWNVYKKVGWHVDEKWSFAEANGSHTNAQGYPAPGDFGVWNDASVMHDWISVQPDERFNYSQAFYNISTYGQNTVAPLYVFWLHTVSSLFPDEAGKKIGLIANLPFYIMTIIFLFLTGDAIFKSKKAGLLTAAYWAFSLGGIASGMYFRFYCMSAATTMMSVYALTRLWFAEKHRVFNYAFLFASVLLACLTMYFYWLFIFIAGIVFAISDCALKKGLTKKAVWVLTALFADVLALTALLPNTMLSIFGINGNAVGYGHEMDNLRNIFSNDALLIESIREFFTTTARNFIASQNFSFTAGKIIITALLMLIIAVVLLIGKFRQKNMTESSENNHSLRWIISLSVIVLMTGIAVGAADIPWISINESERYFWNLMPVIALVFGYVLIKLSYSMKRAGRLCLAIVMCFLSVKASFGLESWLIMNTTTKDAHKIGENSYLFIASNRIVNAASITVPNPLFKEYYRIDPAVSNAADLIVYEIENHIPNGEKVMLAQVMGYSPDIITDRDIKERFWEMGYVLRPETQFIIPFGTYNTAEIVKVYDTEK